MKIGFYYSYLYKSTAGFESFGPFVRYVEELLCHFDEVVLFAPVFKEDIPYRGVLLPSARVKVVELPAFYKFAQSVSHYWKIRKIFRECIGLVDVVIATHVAPFCELLHLFGKKKGIPVVYYIGVLPLDAMERNERYSGWRNILTRSAARAYFWYQGQVTRDCLYLVNGKKVAEQIKQNHARVKTIRSSVMRKDDFFERDDTCTSQPIKILSVSYLEERKDLLTQLDVLNILIRRGHRLKLEIVGDGPMRNALDKYSQELGLTNYLGLPGAVNFGADLNKYYLAADIFFFTSLSEGNPRVIIEAMAHSLPVISTACGSVTEHLKNGITGLLVPFQDPMAMADAIERILTDGDLRRRCIKNGFAEVKNMTVDRYVEAMANAAKAEVDLLRSAGSR